MVLNAFDSLLKYVSESADRYSLSCGLVLSGFFVHFTPPINNVSLGVFSWKSSVELLIYSIIRL